MPKVKTLLITVLVIAFALSLSGCGMLLSRRAEPELAASLDGELPGWLLLSHRSEETFKADEATNLKEPADDEEDEIATGGSDEDDGVTAPSSDQVASTQPAPSSTPSSTPSSNNESSGSSIFETPKPGTREYLVWFADTGGQGSYEEWLKKKMKEAADAEKEAELNAPMDNFGKTSPSGFGTIFDD